MANFGLQGYIGTINTSSTIFHDGMLLIIVKAGIYFGTFISLANKRSSNNKALQAKRPLVLLSQRGGGGGGYKNTLYVAMFATIISFFYF